ncbi:MAG TPA: hypothetical protein VK179_20160 [Bacteroidales bacterium]|nr:hypothetical protein [Bacteroidales bacterium]
MNRILLLFSVLALVACSENNETEKLTRENLFQIAVSSKWQVNLYANGDDIKTDDYTNYKFNFLTNDSVKATNGTNTYKGSWYSGNTENTPSTLGLIFNIEFETPETYALLSREWDVISADQGTIRLRYINGEKVELLTFVSTAK